MARGSPSRRSRSRGAERAGRRERRSRSRRHSESPPRRKVAARSRSGARNPRRRSPTPSPEAPPARPRSPKRYEPSPSKSASPKRKRAPRVEDADRVPPTEFSDYEPSPDGGGWYVYKKTGKWKYHPETSLYLHLKTMVYYVQKEGNPNEFRKIEDSDDPVVKKMRQSEEMRKAIQATDFVQFDESGNPAQPDAEGAAAPGPKPQSGPAPRPAEPEPVKEDPAEQRHEGRVQKWDSDKGFGFIVVPGQDDEKALFVHRKTIVGSTPMNPINLKEGGKVTYKIGLQDGKKCALEVMMLGADGKPLAIHASAQTLDEKKKSYYVTADALGLRVHAESWPGLKKTLQDRYVSDEAMEELGVYFAVLDGHGGTQAADHAAKTLHKNILQQFRQKQVQPASRDEKIKGAVKEAFLQTDKEILSTADRKKSQLVGSTCVSALLHGNPKLGTALRLVIANLGDSRAVLCRGGQAVAVSEDHKPDRMDEKKRVERAGGLVLQVRGAWRVAASTNPNSMSKSARKEYQGLAMTRSFGDLYFKQPASLAVAEPEVTIYSLSDKDLFLVLATDGVYDVLSNQEVVDLALKQWSDPEEAAKDIVRTAYKKGSEDNLTCLVIQFGWADKNSEKYKAVRMGRAGGGSSGAAKGMIIPEKAVDDDVNMFG